MNVPKLSSANEDKLLAKCAGILRSGGIIISPTDTVYGILGDATNAEAVKKIFMLKQRPQGKALPIFVKSIATARKYAYISDAKARFLEKVWEGPVTVVFQHKVPRPDGRDGGPEGLAKKLPRILTGGLNTIGIRIPDHPFLLKLLTRLDFPLVQTSANVSGKPPAKSLKEIKKYFLPNANNANEMRITRTRPYLIIDGGEINGEQSTVIDFTGNEPIILRSGITTKKELDKMWGR